MNILITGCNGQLGSEIRDIEALHSRHEFFNTSHQELDVTDRQAVENYVAEHAIDGIINCSAYTAVDKAETDEDNCRAINTDAPANLAMAIEKRGGWLIHVSTDYVFPGNGSVPKTECDTPAPISAYGSTKYLGEQYVRDLCSRYFIVRTAWLYGYYGKNFVKTIMNAARKFGKLTVVNDQRGNPTNAADLAHHLIKLLDTEEYGIYHGTGTGECSWYDFAAEIVRTAGIDAEVAPCTSEEYAEAHPDAADRPKYSALDNGMFRVTVGDEFRHWQDALKCFMDNYKE